jgi:hypothetical protein
MDAEPGAITVPGAKLLIRHLPMGQIMRPQALGTAAARHILDAINRFSHEVFVGSSLRHPLSFTRG